MRLGPGTDMQLSEVLTESIELWGLGFALEDYLAYHDQLREHSWSTEHYEHLVLTDASGQVLSSCKLYRLKGSSNGRPLNIAQIGAVYTPVLMRGLGHAKTMLDMLMQRIKEQGFDLAILFSDIKPEFYNRLGFQQIISRDLLFDLAVPQKPRRQVLESTTGVPRQVIELDRDREAGSFAISRDESYWNMLACKKNLYNEFQSGWITHEELHYCQDGSAYAWILWNGRRMQIKDLAFNNTYALADVFSALAAKHGLRLLRTAFGWLPQSLDNLPIFAYKRRIERIISLLMVADLTGQNQHLLDENQPPHVWSLDYF